MPKRPKAKVKTTTPTEKQPSAAKQRRILKQLEQTNANKTRKRQGDWTPWEITRHERHETRKAAGKTYENWRKANSARAQEGS